MKYITSVLFVSFFWACTSTAQYKKQFAEAPGYKMKLISHGDQGVSVFEDSLVKISFELSESGYKTSVSGLSARVDYTQYSGIGFSLENKTNETLLIDWDKVSFMDYNGHVGNQVMHQGVKFTDCSSPKSPTIIPENGVISDIVLPCYGVNFISGGAYVSTRWEKSMLPDPRSNQNVEVGFYMPLKIGDKNSNYDFKFDCIAYDPGNL